MSAETRVWVKDDQGVEIVSLTKDRLEETLLLMRESFYTDEPPAKAVQLQSDPSAIDELESLTVETFQDGLSVIAVEKGKVVGASFNKLQEVSRPGDTAGYFENFRDHKCKTDTAKEYVDCMIRMDSKKDVFSHFNVTRSLELMFITTCRSVRGRGVGRLLVRACVEVARHKGLPIISAIFTSQASQHIGKSLGWEQLFSVPMSEHVFRGRPYSDFTGQDDTQILMAHRIQ